MLLNGLCILASDGERTLGWEACGGGSAGGKTGLVKNKNCNVGAKNESVEVRKIIRVFPGASTNSRRTMWIT